MNKLSTSGNSDRASSFPAVRCVGSPYFAPPSVTQRHASKVSTQKMASVLRPLYTLLLGFFFRSFAYWNNHSSSKYPCFWGSFFGKPIIACFWPRDLINMRGWGDFISFYFLIIIIYYLFIYLFFPFWWSVFTWGFDSFTDRSYSLFLIFVVKCRH